MRLSLNICFILILNSSLVPGQSWEWQNATSQDLFDIHFSDSEHGYAVGRAETILKTNDGGKTWVEIGSKPIINNTLDDIISVHFIDSMVGHIGTADGRIFKTGDGGVSWSQRWPKDLEIHVGINSIHFINHAIGVAVGGSFDPFAYSNSFLIIKTTNGGETWETIEYGPYHSQYLYSFHFPSVEVGYAVGKLGYILKTTDGGETWEKQTSGTSRDLKDVHFIDNNIGYIAGEYVIMRTVNGGIDWDFTEVTDWRFTSLSFFNKDTGYVFGGGSTWKTTNAGDSWQVIETPISEDLFGGYFLCPHTGYFVGQKGLIAKFVDENEECKKEQTDYSPQINLTVDCSMLNVYPNPFTDFIQIQYDVVESTNVVVEVFDILGRGIFKNEYLQTDPGRYQLDLSKELADESTGIYLVRMSQGDQRCSQKFMKSLLMDQ